MDEDSDGVRIKVIPCVQEQFRQRIAATKVLENDFCMPNRVQLMLNFLQKHGDRVVKGNIRPQEMFPEHSQACTACFAEILSRCSEVIE